MTIDIYEALTIADIISDHVTDSGELTGAMARLKRAWPEFKWVYSKREDGRRTITIDTRDPNDVTCVVPAEVTDFVEVTEWVRFNADGSSDHIRVADDELIGTEHWDRSPYAQVQDEQGNPVWPPRLPDCDWLVEVKKVPDGNRQ